MHRQDRRQEIDRRTLLAGLYGTGSNIQGVLVARASGQSLSRFCEERIFRPPGMKDTAYFVPPAKIDR